MSIFYDKNNDVYRFIDPTGWVSIGYPTYKEALDALRSVKEDYVW